MIDVDGSYFEGGGQILRTAVALSAITNNSVHIFNIRKGRDKPGLRPQHLHGIAAAGQICDAKIDGLKMNSTEMTFVPGKIKGGKYEIDARTAGSVTLILQTLVPIGVCVSAPLELTVRGGTAVPFSPTIGYFLHVFLPILKMIGVALEIEVRRHGFNPGGGGEVCVKIFPSDLKSLSMKDRGEPEEVRVWSCASRHLKDAKVGERMVGGFNRVIEDVDAQCQYVDAVSPGCFITACARYSNGVLGAGALGKRGTPAEQVGMEAANNLREAIDSYASVDEWMVDQLIPFMALAANSTSAASEVRVPLMTKHAQTSIWVVQKFLPVEFAGDNNVLSCRKASMAMGSNLNT
ncbi:RNA 3'-terminal phosphate cyclase [candidate division WOR-3 bacterium]|nr:RNA 3'-terminal phosphate cyclase [candidate division WOR-3 bacterium]